MKDLLCLLCNQGNFQLPQCVIRQAEDFRAGGLGRLRRLGRLGDKSVRLGLVMAGDLAGRGCVQITGWHLRLLPAILEIVVFLSDKIGSWL